MLGSNEATEEERSMGKPPSQCIVQVISSNPLAARHLAQVLAAESAIAVESPDDSRHAVPGCDVFVIDAAASRNGLEVMVRALSTSNPSAKFVLVAADDSGYQTDPFFFLFSGIHGVVFANETESGLATTVLSVSRGNCCFPAALLEARIPSEQRLRPCHRRGISPDAEGAQRTGSTSTPVLESGNRRHA